MEEQSACGRGGIDRVGMADEIHAEVAGIDRPLRWSSVHRTHAMEHEIMPRTLTVQARRFTGRACSKATLAGQVACLLLAGCAGLPDGPPQFAIRLELGISRAGQ